jgi:hypothetical protein
MEAVNLVLVNLMEKSVLVLDLQFTFNRFLQGISLVGVPKKVVPLSKSAHVSVLSEFILQIKLILSSPNVVLTFYTYKVSNKKVSS